MLKQLETVSLTGLLVFLPILANAQTCLTTSIPASTPTNRFIIDAANGTVTDTKTGLMWKTCTEGQTGATCTGTTTSYTWQAALQQAQTVNTSGGFAGYTDWRVPNIKQLRSIVELQCVPAVNLAVFPNTASVNSVNFWSSSPVYVAGGGGINNAWVIDAYGGTERPQNMGSSTFKVRLVRILPKRTLNDTGILACADNASNGTCPKSTHPNQDAQSGRDVTHNIPSDGHAGFSFTKIGANGLPLAIQNGIWSATGTEAAGTSWSCVQDNVTGLW